MSRSAISIFKRITLALLLLVLVPGITTLWLTHTTSGLLALLQLSQAVTGWRINVQDLRGNLSAGFTAQQLQLRSDGAQVQLRALEIGPTQWSLSARTVHVAKVQARELRITLPSSAATAPPAQLSLPLNVELAQVQISQITLAGNDAAPLTQLETALTWGADLDLKNLQAQWGGNVLKASGHISGTRPFSLEAFRFANAFTQRTGATDVARHGFIGTARLLRRGQRWPRSHRTRGPERTVAALCALASASLEG